MPPDHLIAEEKSFDLTAAGLFTKYTAAGEVVALGIEGCPPPPAGEPPGCYYTLNGLATGEGDLPVEPFLFEDSRLAGTSQHGVLWKGGSYEEETAWVPLFAQLVSNGGPIPLPSSLPPRRAWIRPRGGSRSGPLADESDCRPTDTELDNLGVVTAELVLDDRLEPTIHRLHRKVDLELFYYNNTVDGGGNCDRTGPQIGDGPYHTVDGATVRWAVPASDEGGVWRAVAVYDDEATDRWVPLELAYDASSDRWEGELTYPGEATRLIYFLQAVDNRGNVSWAEFKPEEPAPSGIKSELPMPFEAARGEGCAPGNDSLCLSRKRFRAEVTWRDSRNGTGHGRAVPLAADNSGLFWFFDPNNLEMLVKVLDGCGANNRFWVFAAATTNVEYTLRITDTETGLERQYTNPLGVASPAITDTDAFATCLGGKEDRGSSFGSGLLVAKDLAFSTQPGGVSKLADKADCQASATRLCLNQGRFKVEIEWRDFQGATGPGRVEPLAADDSGLFWFFTPNNLEVLVKVLGGCSFNNRYWVFAAATTNLGYTLKVTDTETGQIKVYTNPLGVASPAIIDTGAFATCP